MSNAVALGDERVLAGFALAGVRLLAPGEQIPADAVLVLVTAEAAGAAAPPDALVVVVPT
ncbi:MAG: hypothetical protein ACXVRJ_08635 [Gaiellaceae bacterium]